MPLRSALLGLDRCLRELREPLRERFCSMGDGRNGAGKREGKIASRSLPHGSVEADILVEKAHFDQRWMDTSWSCLSSCIGKIMASHEGRFEGSTSFARRLNLAERTWIGMRDPSYLVW